MGVPSPLFCLGNKPEYCRELNPPSREFSGCPAAGIAAGARPASPCGGDALPKAPYFQLVVTMCSEMRFMQHERVNDRDKPRL